MTNPCMVYDFTLSEAKSSDDVHDIVVQLRQLAKKWCFQLEESTRRNPGYEGDDEDDDGSIDESVDWSDSGT